jgi:acyl-coenzyme A thioesterase PaaI-like protein
MDKTLSTHLKIDTTLNGDLIEIKEDYAKVALKTLEIMQADEKGLVHGGFAFCAADFTAMAAVNDPYVVLAKSEVKFLAPVKVGETIIFEGSITNKEGKKVLVIVEGFVAEKKVFAGTFYTVVLDKHILD